MLRRSCLHYFWYLLNSRSRVLHLHLQRFSSLAVAFSLRVICCERGYDSRSHLRIVASSLHERMHEMRGGSIPDFASRSSGLQLKGRELFPQTTFLFSG